MLLLISVAFVVFVLYWINDWYQTEERWELLNKRKDLLSKQKLSKSQMVAELYSWNRIDEESLDDEEQDSYLWPHDSIATTNIRIHLRISQMSEKELFDTICSCGSEWFFKGIDLKR